MTAQPDDVFFNRADAIIQIANRQAQGASVNDVSASVLYAAARYNAFVSAGSAKNSEDLRSGREEILAYFVEQYRRMLADNLDDYIRNFDTYLKRDQ